MIEYLHDTQLVLDCYTSMSYWAFAHIVYYWLFKHEQRCVRCIIKLKTNNFIIFLNTVFAHSTDEVILFKCFRLANVGQI